MRLAVIAALAAVGLSSLCAAQSQSCLKPQPVLAGDTPFANGVAFSAQLARSTAGFGEAYIHKAGWFAFTPDVTGQYIIGVCGASVDTKLGIAESCPFDPDLAWDTLAYNDDACAFIADRHGFIEPGGDHAQRGFGDFRGDDGQVLRAGDNRGREVGGAEQEAEVGRVDRRALDADNDFVRGRIGVGEFHQREFEFAGFADLRAKLDVLERHGGFSLLGVFWAHP